MAVKNSTQLTAVNKEITNLLLKYSFKALLRKSNNEQKFRIYQFLNRELMKIIPPHELNQFHESIIKKIHFN